MKVLLLAVLLIGLLYLVVPSEAVFGHVYNNPYCLGKPMFSSGWADYGIAECSRAYWNKKATKHSVILEEKCKVGEHYNITWADEHCCPVDDLPEIHTIPGTCTAIGGHHDKKKGLGVYVDCTCDSCGDHPQIPQIVITIKDDCCEHKLNKWLLQNKENECTPIYEACEGADCLVAKPHAWAIVHEKDGATLRLSVYDDKHCECKNFDAEIPIGHDTCSCFGEAKANAEVISEPPPAPIPYCVPAPTGDIPVEIPVAAPVYAPKGYHEPKTEIPVEIPVSEPTGTVPAPYSHSNSPLVPVGTPNFELPPGCYCTPEAAKKIGVSPANMVSPSVAMVIMGLLSLVIMTYLG